MEDQSTIIYRLNLYKQFKTVVRVKLSTGQRVIGIIDNILSQVVLVKVQKGNTDDGKVVSVNLCHILSVKVNQNSLSYRVQSFAKAVSEKILI